MSPKLALVVERKGHKKQNPLTRRKIAIAHLRAAQLPLLRESPSQNQIKNDRSMCSKPVQYDVATEMTVDATASHPRTR